MLQSHEMAFNPTFDQRPVAFNQQNTQFLGNIFSSETQVLAPTTQMHPGFQTEPSKMPYYGQGNGMTSLQPDLNHSKQQVQSMKQMDTTAGLT